MVRRPQELTAELLREAFPLDDVLGVFEDAWTRVSANRIVASLIETPIIILGGDVIRREGARVAYTGDSWHCDPVPDLDAMENARRSHHRASEYISAYPDPEDGSILYVFVFHDGSGAQ